MMCTLYSFLRLALLNNVILTPHNGYNTPDANYAICELATSVVESYYAGELINEVKN